MIFRQFGPILGALVLTAASPPVLAQTVGPGSSAGRTIRLSYDLYGRGFHVLDVVVDARLTPARLFGAAA